METKANRKTSAHVKLGAIAATKAIRYAAEIAAETIWPTRCAICDTPGDVLCKACESRLSVIDTCKACRICGAPYGINQCSECNKTILGAGGRDAFPLDQMASALVIDDDSKQIVTAFKDHDEHRLCKVIASYMSRYINPAWTERERSRRLALRNTQKANILPTAANKASKTGTQCTVSFIPCTKEAFRRRGFDHAELIAKEIADTNHLQAASVFERPKSIDQRKLGRAERMENMREQFKIRDMADIPKRIILVDDICTTGSTLYSAAEVLREAGAEKIYGLTFGKVLE